jgi:4-hydroxy-L-threonine phosphate dehydrogenase PdxA
MMKRPIIAVTMGDAAGIGPEVIMKSLAHAELYERCRPVVVGDAERLRAAGKIVGSSLQVRSLRPDELDDAQYLLGTVDCLDMPLVPKDLPWGKLSAEAGDAAYHFIAKAAELAVAGKVAAICTGPLNKEALFAAGHQFPGHTEMLAALTGTEEVSMMLSTAQAQSEPRDHAHRTRRCDQAH